MGSKGASRTFNYVLECVGKFFFFPEVYNILLRLVFQVCWSVTKHFWYCHFVKRPCLVKYSLSTLQLAGYREWGAWAWALGIGRREGGWEAESWGKVRAGVLPLLQKQWLAQAGFCLIMLDGSWVVKEGESCSWTSAHLRAEGSLSDTTQNWSLVLESAGEPRYSSEPKELRRTLIPFHL